MDIRNIMASAMLCLAAYAAKAQQADAFPYPSLPDTLRTPESRALYLLEHYWDNVAFDDTTLIHRPEMAEQGFVNFLDLLPRVSPATAATGLRSLADHLYTSSSSAEATKVRAFFADLADRYLGDDDSPMHDDVLYAQFLDVMAANKFADVAMRTHNEFMARNLRRNLPGSVAADFTYVDRQGMARRLYDVAAKYTLLYFYDPDCGHCHDVAGQLAAMPQLTSVSSPIRVLAVYPYSDTQHWMRTAPSYPASWVDACSPDGAIATDDIYYIKSAPSLYLLDAEKRVLLKNPDVKLLKEYVGRAVVGK